MRAISPPLLHWGEGKLTWFGFAAYDASLWAPSEFEGRWFWRHPFVLELTYLRAFSSADIARRSIDEMRRAGPVSDEQAQRWEAALRSAIPDVAKGDRVAGVNRPGRGLAFAVNDRMGPALDDPELARMFFAIWLAPTTSDTRLRSALLQGPAR